MSEGFKPIETQEAFDKAVQARILHEQEKYADYDKIKTRVTELETENGTLQATINETNEKTKNYDTTISDLNAKIVGYETANLRTKIALKNNLPLDLADRLVGEDEESLNADAQRFAGFVKSAAPVPPLKNTEPASADSKDGAYKNLVENLNLEGE
ncbi:capsid assembly scaffolding protein Gp46 family protein [Enterococcus dispar]|uniref:capsid assembly scaffolding protein Gp46 family protein n=1 Tax=Enterococcus dispar TaxID=44009 RepID=UPI0028918E34|nr:DUF4355 domain-containing protein [Enterococcus dispar]MDT2704795.1 DUF4355 domain-containing protein [Enterococcus dispar]